MNEIAMVPSSHVNVKIKFLPLHSEIIILSSHVKDMFS